MKQAADKTLVSLAAVPAAVEARRNDDEVRAKVAHDRQQLRVPVPKHVHVARSTVQVRVDVEARPLALSHERRIAGSRIRLPVVRAEEEHARVVIERVLGAVPVMIVPVDDEAAS